MNRTEREEKIRRVAELLPRARKEVRALVGDYRRVQDQVDALDAALAAGGSIADQALHDAARAFGASPGLMARGPDATDDAGKPVVRDLGQLVVELPETRAFVGDDVDEAEKPALRDLGQLVVELALSDD